MPQVGGIIASRSSFYIAIADMGDDIQSGFKNNMQLTGPLHHKFLGSTLQSLNLGRWSLRYSKDSCYWTASVISNTDASTTSSGISGDTAMLFKAKRNKTVLFPY